MQLLHCGVILSGLPDYVNRLRHIKRGTGGKLLRSGAGRGRGKSPKTYKAKAQTRAYSDAHGLCVKTQADRRQYLPPAGRGGTVSAKLNHCASCSNGIR